MSEPFRQALATLLFLATICLLIAGALVTGTGSGLAVPDWPLSFGQFFPPMIGGVFYEHGHRLVAGLVALLTLTLALSLQFSNERPLLKKIAWLAVGIVILQASLGGMTVLLKLPPAVSISHACLAQIFFSTITILAFLNRDTNIQHGIAFALHRPLRVLTALVLVQLVLGAGTRHLKAGLAISDFPLVFGGFIPKEFSMPIAFHYFHRVLGFGLLAYSIWITWVSYRLGYSKVQMLLGIFTTLLIVQIFLGGLVVWLHRPIWVTTVHLINGAGLLGISALLSFLTSAWAEESKGGYAVRS